MTDGPANENEAPRAAAPCPTCGKPALDHCRPFCSKQCADVDLHRWFSARYVIAGEEDESHDSLLEDEG